MKKIACTILLVLLLAPPAWADWRKDFLEDIRRFGVDRAVENALDAKAIPKDILDFVKARLAELEESRGINTRVTMKALYCAGQERAVVQKAADEVGIPTDEQSEAFEESVAECGSKLSLGDRDVPDKSSKGSVADTTIVGTGVQPISEPEPSPPVDTTRLLGRSPARVIPASPASPSQL